MPGRVWGAVATAFAATLLFGASSAYATTDRDDYDAQVNPICASANAQSEQVAQSFQLLFDQLKHRASKLHGKKKDKLEDRLNGVYYDYLDANIAVYYGELAKLKQVSPAPGDDGLVSDWLTARGTALDLSSQDNALERRYDRLFTKSFSGSLRQFLKFQRKLSILERQLNVLDAQLQPIYRRNIELGAKLGAAYCVSEATGAV